MGAIPDSHRDILEHGGLGFVATIGPKGEPQNNPVWVVWDGEHLKFSLHKRRQKYRNLRRDPRIAIAMADPDNRRRYSSYGARWSTSKTTSTVLSSTASPSGSSGPNVTSTTRPIPSGWW